MDFLSCPFSSITCVCISWWNNKQTQLGGFPFFSWYLKPHSLSCCHIQLIWQAISFGQKTTHPLGIYPSGGPSIPLKYITSSNSTAFFHHAAQLAHSLPDTHPDDTACPPTALRWLSPTYSTALTSQTHSSRTVWVGGVPFLMCLRYTFYSA